MRKIHGYKNKGLGSDQEMESIKKKATWKISTRPFQQGRLKSEENRMENVSFPQFSSGSRISL